MYQVCVLVSREHINLFARLIHGFVNKIKLNWTIRIRRVTARALDVHRKDIGKRS